MKSKGNDFDFFSILKVIQVLGNIKDESRSKSID